MRVTLKFLLVVAICVLGYICYSSLMKPIKFDKIKDTREDAIIARLIDIRTAQIEYKNQKGEHAGSFADLINFLKEEKIPFLKKEGVLTDEQLESGMTEKEAVKKGLIKRDTFWVVAKDTLFPSGYNVDELAKVPFTDINFKMDTATLTSTSGYTIKVFECGVKYDDYLSDLDPQLEYNLKDKAEKTNKFPGLRVGSLTEINNNAGNWED